jgi:hypothetical protein
MYSGKIAVPPGGGGIRIINKILSCYYVRRLRSKNKHLKKEKTQESDGLGM